MQVEAFKIVDKQWKILNHVLPSVTLDDLLHVRDDSPQPLLGRQLSVKTRNVSLTNRKNRYQRAELLLEVRPVGLGDLIHLLQKIVSNTWDVLQSGVDEVSDFRKRFCKIRLRLKFKVLQLSTLNKLIALNKSIVKYLSSIVHLILKIIHAVWMETNIGSYFFQNISCSPGNSKQRTDPVVNSAGIEVTWRWISSILTWSLNVIKCLYILKSYKLWLMMMLCCMAGRGQGAKQLKYSTLGKLYWSSCWVLSGWCCNVSKPDDTGCFSVNLWAQTLGMVRRRWW